MQKAFIANDVKEARRLFENIDWTEWHDLGEEMLEWKTNLENKRMTQLPIYQRVRECVRILKSSPLNEIDLNARFYSKDVYKIFDSFLKTLQNLDFPKMMERRK